MKSAILCDSLAWGGLEMNVFKLSSRLNERSHEVIVFAHPSSPLFRECEKENVSVKSVYAKYKYFDISAAYQLAKEIKKENIKVVIINTSRNIYLAVLTKIILNIFFLAKIKLIYIQHMEIGVRKKGIIQTFLYRNLSAWITPLELLATQVRQKTNMPEKRIHVISFGIDIGKFKEVKESKSEARKLLNIPSDSTIVGTIGRLDPAKGQEFLIRALPHIHKIHPEVRLIFVGEDTKGGENYSDILKRLAESLKVSSYIHFHPFLKNSSIAFAALDIFALTSHSETYGMVTVEAMAAGLPIVATNTGGTPEILGNGDFGLLIPPKNELKLAAAINQLLSDKTLQISLGKKAQQASVNFSYKLQCNRMEDLVSSLNS